MRRNRVGWLALLALAAALPAMAEGGPSHVLAGELVRVNLARRSVGVKLAGPPPREIEVQVGAGTVMSSRGRSLRLADLRPGERIVVACTDDAGAHNAQRIKLGGRQR